MNKLSSLLRIYTDESAYFGDRKVHDVIARRARSAGLAGATAIKAVLGFRRGEHFHTHHVLEDDQSVVIEIVDEEDSLRAFVQALADIPHVGLVTLEPVMILREGPHQP